jgi:epoxyqueuosine reductase
MKIVVHADSAYDLLYFNRWLKKEQWEVLGLFYDPNIHPFSEYNRQLLMQKLLSVLEDIIMIYPEYNFDDYFKGSAVCTTQKERCAYCYRFILEYTAKYAQQLNIPYFSTSWLLNPKHDRELLKKIGDELGEKYKVKFFYHDFQDLANEAMELAEKMNVYKPPYCGCIYSENGHFYPMTLGDVLNSKPDTADKKAAKQTKSASQKK